MMSLSRAATIAVPPILGTEPEALAAARAIAAAVEPGAPERDRSRTAPLAELEAISASGLLGISVPHAHGGPELSRGAIVETFRILARADASTIAFDDRLAVLPAYEAETKRSIDEIQAAIPHEKLAIQYDLPTEVATIEGWFENPFPSPEAILESVARLADWVADDVDLTFHLCYGDSKFGASPFMGTPPDPANDPGGRHILPRDTSTIVYVANGLSRLVDRRIDAIQAATVRSWTRAAHWAPLAGLALEPETEFFLGVVHTEDGIAGARRRIALAAEYLDDFGVSTECGLGRHSEQQLGEAIDIFRGLVPRQHALATVGAASA
jgi:Acyl-CoA dehydrogenase, N-terminal domain